MNITNHLTPTEKWSLAAQWAEKLSKLDHTYQEKLAARIVGLATMTLVCLADTFAHACLALKKMAAGLIISLPKTLMGKTVNKDQQFSSGLIHLIFMVESLFNAAILPLICLVDPAAAYRFLLPRLKNQTVLANDIIEKLQKEIDALQAQIQELNSETIETEIPDTIDQVIDVEETTDFAAEKQKLEDQLQQKQQELNHLQSLLDLKEQENQVLKSNNLSEAQKNFDTLNKQQGLLIKELDNEKKQLAQEKQTLQQDYNNLTATHNQLKSKIIEIEKDLEEKNKFIQTQQLEAGKTEQTSQSSTAPIDASVIPPPPPPPLYEAKDVDTAFEEALKIQNALNTKMPSGMKREARKNFLDEIKTFEKEKPVLREADQLKLKGTNQIEELEKIIKKCNDNIKKMERAKINRDDNIPLGESLQTVSLMRDTPDLNKIIAYYKHFSSQLKSKKRQLEIDKTHPKQESLAELLLKNMLMRNPAMQGEEEEEEFEDDEFND